VIGFLSTSMDLEGVIVEIDLDKHGIFIDIK
jgi:predicted RNA-binding protein